MDRPVQCRIISLQSVPIQRNQWSWATHKTLSHWALLILHWLIWGWVGAKGAGGGGGGQKLTVKLLITRPIFTPQLTHKDLFESIVWSVSYEMSFSLHTVRCRYNVVDFLQNPHDRYLIARPRGWEIGCLLWFWYLIHVLPATVIAVSAL